MVVIRVVSRPASGSVTPKAQMSRPSIRGGRKRRRCASLPCFTMTRGAKMEICTAEAPDMPAPDSADRLHGQRRLGDAEPGPAIFLRHGGADPAAGSEGGDELAGKFPVPVARQPIAVVEPLAKAQHIVPDHLLLVAQHGLPYFKAATYEHLSWRSPQHPFLPSPAGRAVACVDLKPRSILPSFPRKRESRASDGCLACGPGFPLSRE